MFGEGEESRLVEDAITLREERVEELKMNRDALLESLARGMIPEALDTLEPEERSRIYRMLQLEIVPSSLGLRVSEALEESFVKQERHPPVFTDHNGIVGPERAGRVQDLD
jgi:hypothetical protein